LGDSILGENLNGDRARAAESAAKSLRAVLRTEEPEEHAKAIYREVVDRAQEILKGHKNRPFSTAQTEMLCELIAGAIHMSNLASKKPDGWVSRLFREYFHKQPMDQIKIAFAVLVFAAGLTGAVSLGWHQVPGALRRMADTFDGNSTVASEVNVEASASAP
jgi:hypothetical protein